MTWFIIRMVLAAEGYGKYTARIDSNIKGLSEFLLYIPIYSGVLGTLKALYKFI